VIADGGGELQGGTRLHMIGAKRRLQLLERGRAVRLLRIVSREVDGGARIGRCLLEALQIELELGPPGEDVDAGIEVGAAALPSSASAMRDNCRSSGVSSAIFVSIAVNSNFPPRFCALRWRA
jgi:hypothetical protein